MASETQASEHEQAVSPNGQEPTGGGDKAEAAACSLREALEFYADPETYFGIGIFADSPHGDFMDDFDNKTNHPDGNPWTKPGKRARTALAEASTCPHLAAVADMRAAGAALIFGGYHSPMCILAMTTNGAACSCGRQAAIDKWDTLASALGQEEPHTAP